ncbi:MAG TPA: guanylate kinase [Flavobacteriales bacterium]|nr:guanylate kinase [Flavobacteriales bacterium]
MTAGCKALVFSAPSGAGKTTLVRKLMAEREDLAFSISATNRALRGDEVNGHDYHFFSTEEFKARIDAGEFLEWEEVYPGRYYGTLKTEVQRHWSAGKHILFDVDVEGGLRLKSILKDDILAVFVCPPSLEVLEERLRRRGTDSEEDIARRLAKAEAEMLRSPGFDVELVNDILEEATEELIQRTAAFLGPMESK